MRIQLEHINITVTDVDKAIAFFQCAFPEFRIRHEGLTADKLRWLHLGTDSCYMAINEMSGSVAEAPLDYNKSGYNHAGFVVDSVDEVIQRLEQAGYEEGYKPEDHQFRKRIYYLDGLGHEWEFIEYTSEKIEERNDYSS